MELSIDTAGDWASVALSQEGRVQSELTWHCPRTHSVELLPTVEMLLERAGARKEDISAVFVCKGPGGYAGLRAGMSTAKGLAYALDVPLVGLGRLEIEAYQHAAYRGPVCPVHRAGRGQVAWAAYQGPAEEWRELIGPRMAPPQSMVDELPAGALLCGEVTDEVAALIGSKGEGLNVASPAASLRRAGFLAELGWRRLARGQTDDAKALVPLYLREPAIGPQKP
jgi:tRNA threonylcarbamoyladenosine biosynthesis protein TsaB